MRETIDYFVASARPRYHTPTVQAFLHSLRIVFGMAIGVIGVFNIYLAVSLLARSINQVLMLAQFTLLLGSSLCFLYLCRREMRRMFDSEF